MENPQTTFYTGPNAYPASVKLTDNATPTSGFDTANTLSLNHIPDVIAKVAYEPTFAGRTAHVEVFGLYRSFYERLNYTNENSSGGGFGGGLNVPLVPGFLDFQVSGLAGKGIGRYGAGQLSDVTFDLGRRHQADQRDPGIGRTDAARLPGLGHLRVRR